MGELPGWVARAADAVDALVRLRTAGALREALAALETSEAVRLLPGRLAWRLDVGPDVRVGRSETPWWLVRDLGRPLAGVASGTPVRLELAPDQPMGSPSVSRTRATAQ